MNNATLVSRTFILLNEYGIVRNGRPMSARKLHALYIGGTMSSGSRRKRRNHLWGMLAPFSTEISLCAIDEENFYIGRPLRGDIILQDQLEESDVDDMGDVSRTRTPESDLSASDDDLEESDSGIAVGLSGPNQ